MKLVRGQEREEVRDDPSFVFKMKKTNKQEKKPKNETTKRTKRPCSFHFLISDFLFIFISIFLIISAGGW